MVAVVILSAGGDATILFRSQGKDGSGVGVSLLSYVDQRAYGGSCLGVLN